MTIWGISKELVTKRFTHIDLLPYKYVRAGCEGWEFWEL